LNKYYTLQYVLQYVYAVTCKYPKLPYIDHICTIYVQYVYMLYMYDTISNIYVPYLYDNL